MANSIVGGLFGIDPTQYQQQQDALAGQQALQFAQLAPMQQAQYGIYKGANQLGGAIGGMLGAQDPELQKATMAKQLATQFDLSTPAGMKQYAQALSQNGAPDLAQMALVRAQDMEAKGLGIEKTRMEVTDLANFRKEVAALGPNATDNELIALAVKYGDPDKVVSALSAKGSREVANELRKTELERKQGLDDEKRQKSFEAQKEVLGNIRDSAIEGKTLVDNIRKQVSTSTVGAGSVLANLPMTEARKFKADLDTLKSQLTLAAMNLAKSQSKTGATGFGALNKEELKVLQTNIANLDTALTVDDFNSKLTEVYTYFEKLDNKALEKMEKPQDRKTPPSDGTPPPKKEYSDAEIVKGIRDSNPNSAKIKGMTDAEVLAEYRRRNPK